MDMQDLYGQQLDFISPDPRIFVEKLGVLQTPEVADRVRVLSIWPAAIRDAMRAIQAEHLREMSGRRDNSRERSKERFGFGLGHSHVPERSQTPMPSGSKSKHGRHIRYLSRGKEYMGELLGRDKDKEREKEREDKPLYSPRTPRSFDLSFSSLSLSSSSDSFSTNDPASSVFPDPQTADLFQTTIRKLRNVDQFELNWYLDKTTAQEYAWKFPFFLEIWHSIGANLRVIRMDLQLFKMNDVVRFVGPLPRVEEEWLTLRCDTAGSSGDKSPLHPGDTAVPYLLNKLQPSLQRLSLKTIGHQDLSLNFQLLGRFPRLNTISLEMPLDTVHLQDPSGLRAFLNEHPSVRELSVRYKRCCGEGLDDGFNAHLESGVRKHLLYSDISMPELQVLELGLHLPVPIPVPPTHLYAAISKISGSSLTSLTFKDRNLKLDELRTLLRLFNANSSLPSGSGSGSGHNDTSYRSKQGLNTLAHSGRLKNLSVIVKYLSPQLVDYLAYSCPKLNSLSLDVEMVVREEGENENDVDGFILALLNYAVDLENDRWRYRTWLLSDISIMQWQFKVGHEYNWECMKAISRAVPSVRSFAGRGYLEFSNSNDVRTTTTQSRAEVQRPLPVPGMGTGLAPPNLDSSSMPRQKSATRSKEMRILGTEVQEQQLPHATFTPVRPSREITAQNDGISFGPDGFEEDEWDEPRGRSSARRF